MGEKIKKVATTIGAVTTIIAAMTGLVIAIETFIVKSTPATCNIYWKLPWCPCSDFRDEKTCKATMEFLGEAQENEQ